MTQLKFMSARPKIESARTLRTARYRDKHRYLHHNHHQRQYHRHVVAPAKSLDARKHGPPRGFEHQFICLWFAPQPFSFPMKPQSRVLLLLLLFTSLSSILPPSLARNLLSPAPLCFLLSLYSVLLRPVSSFSLFPFVISRALFFFIFFDALLPPAPIPRCLLLVSVIMSRLSSGCSSSILVSGSGGFGQCAPLNI